MRRGAVLSGLITVALAVVASTALGAYKTSPEEGRKYAKKAKKVSGLGPAYRLRGCWRIGPGGVGGTYKYLPGGVVCRFSGPIITSGSGEEACRIYDFAAKQGKKRNAFVTDHVTKFTTDRPYWIGREWCDFVPGAEEPSAPIGSTGPPLFG
jgi:hypothetical protein